MKIWDVAYTDLKDGTKHHKRFESDQEAYEWIFERGQGLKIWNVVYTDLKDGSRHYNRFENDQEVYEWIFDMKNKGISPEIRCVERF